MRILVGVLAISLLGNSGAFARTGLSCDFYDQLDKQCGCREADQYFVSYGRRYCERFLNSTGWTAAGNKWRDRTLVCLQDTLARGIMRTNGGACDCKRAKDIAWQTHVQCYTQSSASVCKLPVSDLARIYGIIDVWDLLSPYGISQFFSIAKACLQRPP
jgi:hypothetical protein